MPLTYRILLVLHVLAAVLAVVVFWASAIAKKGSARHIRVGRMFVWSMVTMCISALLMSALNIAVPAAVHSLEEFRVRGATLGADMSRSTVEDLTREFRLNAIWLTYAGVQLLVALRFGIQVVRTRRTGGAALAVDAGLAALVLISGFALTFFGARVGHPLITMFGVMGAVSNGRRLFVMLRPPRSEMAWFLEHMGTLLGTGIPLHVTFLLALSRHLPGPPGPWRVALSGMVILGLPAITMWKLYYRRRFERRPSRAHGTSASRPAATQPA